MPDWHKIVDEFEAMARRFEGLAEADGDAKLNLLARRLRRYAEEIREDETVEPPPVHCSRAVGGASRRDL